MPPPTDLNQWDILPELVAHGILGVSVAMLLLSFFLFYKVINQQTVHRIKARLSIIFLGTSFLFMISAGGLEIYQAKRHTTIVLNVTPPWEDHYRSSYGEIYIRQGISKTVMTNNAIKLDVKHESEVDLQIHRLMRSFDSLQRQVNNLGQELAKSNKKKRKDIGYDENHP